PCVLSVRPARAFRAFAFCQAPWGNIAVMDNRKFLILGFIVCVLAALAYTFVFADLPFVTGPTSPDGAPLEVPAPAPATQPAP
ncbi:MAG TPA: hypothetical protein VNR51_09165, partial [Hyphomicrobium sp.]|nr:hypothetical protein [Hyphomicrobium sp.]